MSKSKSKKRIDSYIFQEKTVPEILTDVLEEGIAFSFDHGGDAEELVLVDANAAYPAVETVDGASVRVSDPHSNAEKETVMLFEWLTALRPTAVVVRELDWTRPQLDLTASFLLQGGAPRRATELDGQAASAPMSTAWWSCR